MSTDRTIPRTPEGMLPFVAAQPLVDHHCHGLLRSGGDLAGLLNEADGAATAAGMPFDSLAGLALRRWCAPPLDLPPHASAESYQERRAALGSVVDELDWLPSLLTAPAQVQAADWAEPPLRASPKALCGAPPVSGLRSRAAVPAFIGIRRLSGRGHD